MLAAEQVPCHSPHAQVKRRLSELCFTRCHVFPRKHQNCLPVGSQGLIKPFKAKLVEGFVCEKIHAKGWLCLRDDKNRSRIKWLCPCFDEEWCISLLKISLLNAETSFSGCKEFPLFALDFFGLWCSDWSCASWADPDLLRGRNAWLPPLNAESFKHQMNLGVFLLLTFYNQIRNWFDPQFLWTVTFSAGHTLINISVLPF